MSDERGNDYSYECKKQDNCQSLYDLVMNSSQSTYNPDLYTEYDKPGSTYWYLKNIGEHSEIGYADQIALMKTVIRCQKFLRKENVAMSQTNLSNNDSMLHAENYTGLETKRIDRKYRYVQEKPQDDSQWHGTPTNPFLHISKRYADDQHEEYDSW